MKTCPRCKVTKSLDEFYKKKDRRAGSYCKPCQHAYLREHYQRTSTTYNARRYAWHNEYTKRNRRIVIEHLMQNGCVDCGESDIVVLDFDHVEGKKIQSISRMMRGGTAIAKLQAEMAKCVIRCANCHRRKTAVERGSYRAALWTLYDENAGEQVAGDALKLWDGRGSNSRQIG